MEKIHFDIKITGFLQKPGLQLRLMRMAELHHITGYATWGKDEVVTIEAEGKETDITQFINFLKEIPGIENDAQILSKKPILKGFREFSIIDY